MGIAPFSKIWSGGGQYYYRMSNTPQTSPWIPSNSCLHIYDQPNAKQNAKQNSIAYSSDTEEPTSATCCTGIGSGLANIQRALSLAGEQPYAIRVRVVPLLHGLRHPTLDFLESCGSPIFP